MDNRYEFIEGLENLDYDLSARNAEETTYDDFGFDLQLVPIKDVGFDLDKEATKYRRDKNNYPFIGAITSTKGFENFKNNDVVISINNLDLSKLKDTEIDKLIYPEDLNKFHKITVKRDGKKLKKKIKAHQYLKEYRTFQFLYSINKIDLKNSTVNFQDLYLLIKNILKMLMGYCQTCKKFLLILMMKSDYSYRLRRNSIYYAKENGAYIGESFGFDELVSEDKDKVYESINLLFLKMKTQMMKRMYS